MGRRIEMRKIEDLTKCQVTYSKRRSSLMKKMDELAVCCDANVGFVAFSPSGRICKFSGEKRIEDVLLCYIDIPAGKRFNHISDVQGKLEKLRNLTDHINGESSKLQYLDKQIENLELQIKKSDLELQILEAGLRDYEVDAEEHPSLYQLSWCERNLKHTLERVIARKNAMCGNFIEMCGQPNLWMDRTELEGPLEVPFTPYCIKESLDYLPVENPSFRQILEQQDPQRDPYSGKVGTIPDFLFYQIESTTNGDPGPSSNAPNIASPSPMNVSSFTFRDYDFTTMLSPDPHTLPLQMPLEESMTIDETSFNVIDRNSVYAGDNVTTVNFSDDICMPAQKLYSNCRTGDSSIVDVEEECDMMITNKIYENDESQYALLDENLLVEDAFGGDIFWESKMQKSTLSEWEELDLDHFNFQDSL